MTDSLPPPTRQQAPLADGGDRGEVNATEKENVMMLAEVTG
jgi:hypothetical protein